MATVSQVATDVAEIGAIANSILQAASAVDPALEAPAETVALLSDLVTKAVAAFAKASGQPVTAASIEALMPNATPLTPPVVL